jgi:hypothetical protein
MSLKEIEVTKDELSMLRALPDFDLIMVLSDIHDHGWPVARTTLVAATQAVEAARQRGINTDGSPVLNS